MFVLYKRTFNRRQGLQLLVLLINEPGRALLSFDAPRSNSLPLVEGVGGASILPKTAKYLKKSKLEFKINHVKKNIK